MPGGRAGDCDCDDDVAEDDGGGDWANASTPLHTSASDKMRVNQRTGICCLTPIIRKGRRSRAVIGPASPGPVSKIRQRPLPSTKRPTPIARYASLHH